MLNSATGPSAFIRISWRIMSGQRTNYFVEKRAPDAEVQHTVDDYLAKPFKDGSKMGQWIDRRARLIRNRRLQ